MKSVMDDVTRLSLNELRALKAKIEREIQKRGEKTKKDLLRQIQKLAAQSGMSLAEVIGEKPVREAKPVAEPKARKRGAAKKRMRKPVAPRYRNPDDSTMTWTGRGRKPLWVEKALGDGRSIDDLLIAS